MSQPRFSRQLAGRVEVEFHHHPNRFRRFTWWTALVCVLAACVWLVQAGTRGEHRIYEAGDVATPHAMFENDCYLCHVQNMAPLKRLIGFSDQVHSVTNEKCIACHVGPTHHENQVPMHGNASDQLSCAKCHREHEGDEELARVADRHCTDCHSELETSPGTPTFAVHVTNFEEEDGHPDFKIEELLGLDQDVEIRRKPNGDPVHHAFAVLGYIARAGEEKKSWQDKARINFNHKAHLKMMYDENGERITDEEENAIERRSGTKAGQPIPYPQSCADCHEFDADRRYMKPVNYEKHCQKCHHLTYDSEKTISKINPVTGEWEDVADEVPHESTDIVRGYLSKVYNLDTLDDKPNETEVKENPLAELRRGFPGRNFEANFTEEQARKIYEKISETEKSLYPLNFVTNEIKRRKSQGVLFKENGGCALCHDINKYKPPQNGDVPKPESKPPKPWEIVKPEIPDRWYKHSWFRHDSHRMVSCIECHFDMKDGHAVYDSASTGDVLMPKRMLCAKCHRTGPAKVVDEGDSHLLGARADCVECHGYHDYSKEDFDGNLDLGLRPRSKNSTATPTGHGSK